MKTLTSIIGTIAIVAATTHAQGVFRANNVSAPTRAGSLNGGLASTNTFGQFYAGPTTDSLAPVGAATAHYQPGFFSSGSVTVPTVPLDSAAFVQFWAWDSTLWGTDYTLVPMDQFGRTDIVAVILTTGMFPDLIYSPPFTQPAIVPIPEPSAMSLTVIGGVCLFFFRRFRRRKRLVGVG